MKQHRPFRQILSLQLLLVAMIPLLLTGILMAILVVPKTIRETETYHRNLTEILVVRIKSFFHERAVSLHAVGTAVQENQKTTEISQILDSHVNSNPMFEAIYLLDPEGKISAVGLPSARLGERERYFGATLPHKLLLSETRKTSGLIWSDAFNSSISKSTSVVVATPMQKNLLVGEINLQRLTDYLNQLHDVDIRSLVIGRNGEIIANSSSVMKSEIDEFQGLSRINKQGNQTLPGRFHLNGKEMIGSMDALEHPPWKVLVYEPAASAYQSLFEVAIILTVVAALALLAVFAASLILARRVERRFDDFSRQANSIAIADYDSLPMDSKVSEVNHFAISLRHMANAIQDREMQLKSSERKYRDLVEGSHDLIVLCDLDCIIIYANHASARILGMEPDSCIGRSGFEFLHPDDREFLMESMQRWSHEKPSSVLLENRIVSATGDVHHMLWSISIHQANEDGEIEFLGIGHDTTEHKMHAAREQRLINLQRALSETNDAILRLEHEYALFPLVCRIAVEYGGMMLAWVGTVDPSGVNIVPATSFGEDTSYLDGIEISTSGDDPTGRSLIGTAWREKRHVIANDYASDELVSPWRERARQYGLRSGACFPILRNGKPYAVFVVNSDQSDAFNDEIVHLLKEIAANISFALDNFDREAARRLAEAALRDSEERFRMVIDAAPFPMQLHAEDGQILLINQAWVETTGYVLEDIPTMDIWTKKACGDHAVQAMENIRHLFLVPKKVSEEYLINCKDGSQRICYFTSSSVGTLADGRRAMISMAMDVTEARMAEKALQLTHFSINQASDPLFWITQDSHIHFVNDAACNALGYTEKELLSLSIFDLDPSMKTETWSEMWRDLMKKKASRHETTIIGKNRNAIQVEVTSNYVAFEGKEYNCAFVRDITEKKKTEELVWRQANFDTLTGLPNRSMFLNRLEHELRKADRSGCPVAVFFLDLDHFKNVNDTLGHNMGDILLKEAAERLRNCLRETDTVARLGGDEFTVILSELHDMRSIDRVAKNIQQAISEPYQLGEEIVYVSTSIGITIYPEDAAEIDNLLKNADQAMYAAKHDGRKCHHYFTQSMQEAAISRMNLIKDLRVALDNDQFEVTYQPIVELATGEVRKAEALVRWHHPKRGLINPSDVIPAAEETGLIHEIGDWVFWQAADQATEWRQKLHPQFQISVNMSPVQFRESEKSRAAWLKYLQSLEIPWMSITVEITEGLLLDANPSISEQLLAFHDAGMQVAIDDFGIGYSSLSYLKNFDIDYLKIDRTFVNNLGQDSHDLALCEAIIVMAHKLGIKVIAEGVETDEQRRLLTEAGCDFAQGYLFSEPQTPEVFKKMYQKGFNRSGEFA